jgi:hypothetical protein
MGNQNNLNNPLLDFDFKPTQENHSIIKVVGDEFLPEDVNHDGEVNIADVNCVIDYILKGASEYNCDANLDGEANIADVNAIIDYILKH